MTPTSPSFDPSDDPIQRRLAQARRKRQRSLSWLVWASAGLFVVALAVSLTISHRRSTDRPAPQRRPGASPSSPTPKNRSAAEAPEPRRTAAAPPEKLAATALFGEALPPVWDSPTTGQSLDLRYLPAGVHLLVSLRPAAVLASPTGREVVEGLGPAADSLLSRLEQFCGVPPTAVEHVLVGWIPSTDGRPPRAAAVIRLAEPMARSALLQSWGNPAPATEGVQRYYLAPDAARAFHVVDEQTFVVAPPELMREVLADSGRVQPMPRYLEAMISHSDVDRHLSIAFDTEFLRDDARHLFPAEATPLVNAVLTFLGDDAPAGIFSVHLAPELFAELAVTTSTGTLPHRLSAALDERLQQIPYDLLDEVRTVRPRRGGRLVGRFPAMVKALAVCTSLDLTGRTVLLRVLLPERAGPNLAWAAPLLLAEVNRSAAQRTASAPLPRSGQRSLQELLARPITVGFRRTPLREAVGMIADEAGFDVEFLMKDLEAIGVTGNIPQDGEYRDVPPTEILDAVLTKLELVYIADAKDKKIYITSRKAALERGQIRSQE